MRGHASFSSKCLQLRGMYYSQTTNAKHQLNVISLRGKWGHIVAGLMTEDFMEEVVFKEKCFSMIRMMFWVTW